MNKRTFATRAFAVGIVAASVAGLAACGDATDATANTAASSAEGSTSVPVPTETPNAGGQTGTGRGGIDAATQTKITACLKAAGITVPTMGPRPTGAPDGNWNGGTGGTPPNGTRPSGAPDANAGPGGAGGGIFGSTEAQAALKACGITLPSRPSGAPNAQGGATTS